MNKMTGRQLLFNMFAHSNGFETLAVCISDLGDACCGTAGMLDIVVTLTDCIEMVERWTNVRS